LKIICALDDVKRLRSDARLASDYIRHIASFFQQLREALSDRDEGKEFTLHEHGYIVLLEPGDDVRRLKGLGLDEARGGLLGAWPEFVEIIELETVTIYRLLVLYDNEYGHTFLSIRGQLDPEAEAWLADQAE